MGRGGGGAGLGLEELKGPGVGGGRRLVLARRHLGAAEVGQQAAFRRRAASRMVEIFAARDKVLSASPCRIGPTALGSGSRLSRPAARPSRPLIATRARTLSQALFPRASNVSAVCKAC